ncbi:MAG: hypothetical protein FWC36_04780 [Spirochaetes bacterium]|nr:hypothetical protein [Spirochaetota bacterium]
MKHTLFLAAIALFFLIAACEPFDGTAFDDNFDDNNVYMLFVGNDDIGIFLSITNSRKRTIAQDWG